LVPADDDPGLSARGNSGAPDRARTLRADVAEADAVLDGVAETHALLTGLRRTAQGMEQTRHLADLLLAQLAPLRPTASGDRSAMPTRCSRSPTSFTAE
jgi:hypothetical protein